jgi:putative molybdopterin biosynthesis protein
MDEMKYLTTEEVAKKLRVTTWTIYNLIKRGELNAFRVGAQWRIPQEEVNAMIERSVNKKKEG